MVQELVRTLLRLRRCGFCHRCSRCSGFNGGGESRSWFAVEDAVKCFEDPHGSTVFSCSGGYGGSWWRYGGFRGFDAVVNGSSSGFAWLTRSSSSEVWVSHHPLDSPCLVFTGPVEAFLLGLIGEIWKWREGDRSMGRIAWSGSDSVETVVAVASFSGDKWRIWYVGGERTWLEFGPFPLCSSICRGCREAGYLGFTGSNAPATVQTSISRVRAFCFVSVISLVGLFCTWAIDL